MNPTNNRRNFIKTAAIGTVASLSIPQIASSAFAAETFKKITFSKDDVILFQGDSITDWGRDHSKSKANDISSLGTGYAMLTAAQILAELPDKNLQIFNKGVSGNKVYQLAERWDADCLALKPNILSIHVGVNDYWHTITGGYKGTIDTYIGDYHKLLDRTKQLLSNVQFIICEPFGLKGVKFVDDSWYPTFDLFRKAAKDIANEYNAAFVPWQSVMDKAIQTAPATYWSLDGVHPALPGEVLMAKAWMDAVKG